jgi:hypothetical protein
VAFTQAQTRAASARAIAAPDAPAEKSLWEKQARAEVMLKQGLREPKSLEIVGWTRRENKLAGVVIPQPYEVWALTYRAKNGFGGYNLETQVFVFGPNGVVPYRN